MRTRTLLACLLGALAACGAAPRELSATRGSAAPAAPLDAPHVPDPDLDRAPARTLLAIDWTKVQLASDADALALWAQIAPTGADWEEKLFEVPNGPISKALAIAMLHAGNVACVPPATKLACGPAVPDSLDPADDATFADPCLRRALAMWSLDQLDPADLPQVHDALAAIAALPPPESQLVSDVLEKDVDNPDQNAQLALLVRAWQAGQHEIVNGRLGELDEAHLVEAVQKDHIDGALEVLSADGSRAVYLKAIADERLGAAARALAIAELSDASSDALPSDLRAALLAVTRTASCTVAAAAAHALATHGVREGVPGKGPATMRALCVVASYEQLQVAGETSPLASYIPPRGLELVKVAYDPDGDTAVDPDGDPHTQRTTDLIPRAAVVFPESDDLVRAFAHCKGTTCATEDHEFRFTLRNGFLVRLEIDERPPCKIP